MSKERASRRLPVLVTFVVALMLSITPMPEWAAPYRPDWVALTLIYWSIRLPKTYGVGTAWIVGIVMDVAQGTLLGQHAIALSLVAYLTVKFHLQLRVFPASQMAATVLGLLAVYQFILFWVNGVADVAAAPATYWWPVITGGLLWPVVALVLRTVPYRTRARA